MKFKNKRAVITGASTGIGQAIAQAIASEGGYVGLLGRDTDGLQQTSETIKSIGGQSKIFIADLRNEDDINQSCSAVLKTLGGVDIVANVAGVWHDATTVYYGPHLDGTPSAQINEVLDVGIRAPMLLTRLLLPAMIEKKSGKVLNISGTFSHGGSGWLHYYVSKKAIEYFTIGLADEMRQHQIQVNCISPSDVATEALKKFFPEDAKTALDPQEVAKLALFLLSEDAWHITGQIVVIKSNIAP
jgi:NAD(P)-dependent dehydrogenase (short-subunit alcohol dehydrogenase family)